MTTCVWVDPTPLLIEVPGAFLTPAFRGSTTDYQIDVDAETTSVRVRVILPLPTDGVEITLNGEPLEQEVLSAPVPVAVGETALYVGTVAESGRSALYTLRVVRPSGGGPP